MNPGLTTSGMMHLHIGHHFWGAGNVGDDWMLAGFLEAVNRRGLQFRITCCIPHCLDAMRLRFPQIEWHGMDIGIRRSLIIQADVWLGLGDTPFQSHTGTWLLDHIEEEMELCRLTGTPAYFLAVGAESRDACQLPQTRRILEQARRVWTRDALTAALLSDAAGKSRHITPAADLAHIYFDSLATGGTDPATGAVGLVIHVENAGQLNVEELSKFISRHGDSELRWIAQEVRSLPISEIRLWENFSLELKQRMTLALPDYAAGSIASFLEPYAGLSALLTTRYHSTLAAAWRGVAVSVFTRSQKLEGIVRQLGCATCHDLTTADSITAGVASARPVSLALLREAAQQAQSACDEFFQELDQIVSRPKARNAQKVAEAVSAPRSPRFNNLTWLLRYGDGTYPLEGSARWLAKQAEISLPTELLAVSGSLTFSLTCGDLWCYGKRNVETTVTLDGRTVARLFFDRNGQAHDVSVLVGPCDHPQSLVIESSIAFVPAQIDSTSRDERSLAVRLEDVAFVESHDGAGHINTTFP